MLRLGIGIKLCVLIVLCSGCLTTNKYVGKELHPNYYICHCQTFPAYGYQKEKYFIYNYEVQKLEGPKFLLKGTAKFDTSDPDLKALAMVDRLELDFVLIKDSIIIDSISVTTTGNPSTAMAFKKSFTPKTNFDGITIIGRYVSGWY
jgi:hypothetical protein